MAKPSAEQAGKAQDVQGLPEGAQTLFTSLLAARNTQCLWRMRGRSSELAEILEFVWPTRCVQEQPAVSVGKAVILGPKEAGVERRKAPDGTIASDSHR